MGAGGGYVVFIFNLVPLEQLWSECQSLSEMNCCSQLQCLWVMSLAGPPDRPSFWNTVKPQRFASAQQRALKLREVVGHLTLLSLGPKSLAKTVSLP